MLQRAGAWFLYSGIQNEAGGVARYYRSDIRENARVSTEITGYSISALALLHARTGCAEYAEAALRAARFLTQRAWDPMLRAFPFEWHSNGHAPQPLTYFFDSGIIVRGLLTAYRRVRREQQFLDAAAACGCAMLSDFVTGEAIHPILSLPKKNHLPYEPRWSAGPGCYQLKAALAWFELAEETGESRFRDAYEESLDRALVCHETFLPGDTRRDKVMDRLHAYTYFLEGLIPRLSLRKCADAFKAGVGRIAHYLREIAPEFARSDVYAQLLRVRLYGEAVGVLPLDEAAAAHEAEELATFQLSSSDLRIDGGFSFGRRGSESLPFVNPVSTAFCMQALDLWNNRSQAFSTQDLI